MELHCLSAANAFLLLRVRVESSPESDRPDFSGEIRQAEQKEVC